MHTPARNLHCRRANKLTVTPASFLMQHKTERANLFYHQGNISSGTKLINYRPRRELTACANSLLSSLPPIRIHVWDFLSQSDVCIQRLARFVLYIYICKQIHTCAAMNGNKETPLAWHLSARKIAREGLSFILTHSSAPRAPCTRHWLMVDREART